jgi:lipopolysaccharide/colanic/teichoic acid biosynthesis glycosyltransferase
VRGLVRKRQDVVKRVLDVTLCITSLPVVLPMIIIIAVMVKASSPGPVLYRAARIGRNMVPFVALKFRTMATSPDTNSGPRVTRSGDPRITAVGRWLRATKLDELPQLWNVVRGDMSLVGPRPEDPKYVSRYTPEQRRVLSVPPGLTSLAFLHFGHEQKLIERSGASDTEGYYVHELMPAKLAIELEYVRDRSIGNDVKILARTFTHLLS